MRLSYYLFCVKIVSASILIQSCVLQSKIVQAEKNAINYLDAAQISFDHAFLYVHLQDKYRLPELNFKERLKEYESNLKKNEDEKSAGILKNLALYKGLIDKNYSISKTEIDNTSDLNYLVLSALYCKHYPVDSTEYFKYLKEKSAEGDYTLTHSLLAIYLLNFNGCFEKADLESYRKILINENLAMVSKTGYSWNDINIEAVALAQELGYKLPAKHIKQILKNQQADGGWKTECRENASSPHTTVLSLWALLAFRKGSN